MNRFAFGAAAAAALAFLVAQPRISCADDAQDAAARELKLLPRAEKGQEEKLVFEASLKKPGQDGQEKTTTAALALRRKIREVEGDLPSHETISVENAVLDGVNFGAPQGGLRFPIDRTRNKARRASVEEGGPEIPDVLAPELLAVLRRDPDGLARALTPRDKVKRGDEWEVDLKALLVLFGPPKAKLVAEGSKATARLEAAKTKDGVPQGEIALDATIKFTPREDPDETVRLKITGSLKGALDGSASPAREELTVFVKHGDDSKETITSKLERSKAEPEKEEGEQKGDAEKGEKKPDEKKAD